MQQQPSPRGRRRSHGERTPNVRLCGTFGSLKSPLPVTYEVPRAFEALTVPQLQACLPADLHSKMAHVLVLLWMHKHMFLADTILVTAAYVVKFAGPRNDDNDGRGRGDASSVPASRL